MQFSIFPDFPVICPNSRCSSHPPLGCEGPSLPLRVRKRGTFRRKDSLSHIRRYDCSRCHRSFSRSTFEAEFRQQVRVHNETIQRLCVSGLSIRRMALLLGLSRELVARRIQLYGGLAQRELQKELKERSQDPRRLVTELQFDELETIEHTKLKPLSIGLAVETSSRRILGISVASMPCGGPLAHCSRKKYGPRKDERAKKASELFASLRPVVHPSSLKIRTDQKTLYPQWLKAHFPQMKHEAYKGRRGCVVGQGELKKIGFDPLFSLNHTAAMLRANINRLFRRTWCTTKKPERLLRHLYLYVRFHNSVLLENPAL